MQETRHPSGGCGSEEYGHTSWNRAGRGRHRHHRSLRRRSDPECGLADRPCHHVPRTHRLGGGLIGPALHGIRDRRAQRRQQRVGARRSWPSSSASICRDTTMCPRLAGDACAIGLPPVTTSSMSPAASAARYARSSAATRRAPTHSTATAHPPRTMQAAAFSVTLTIPDRHNTDVVQPLIRATTTSVASPAAPSTAPGAPTGYPVDGHTRSFYGGVDVDSPCVKGDPDRVEVARLKPSQRDSGQLQRAAANLVISGSSEPERGEAR